MLTRPPSWIVASLGTLLPFAACSTEEPGKTETSKPVVLRLAHAFPAGSGPDHIVEGFASRVEERSKGALAVDVTTDADLGVGAEFASQLGDGSHEAALITTTATGLDPRLHLQTLPFLATSPDEADELFYGDGPVADYEASVFEEYGIHSVYQFEVGFRGLSTNGTAVRVPKDLAGLTLGVAPTALDTFNAWGVKTKPITATGVYDALDRGEIDGQESGARYFLASELADVQETFTDLRHTYTTMSLVVDQSTWDGLSREDRRILEDSAMDISTASREQLRDGDEKALDALGEDVEVIRLNSREFAPWSASVVEVYEQHRDTFGRRIFEELRKQAGSS